MRRGIPGVARAGVEARFLPHGAVRLRVLQGEDILSSMGSISETYRYIVKTPGVRGGKAHVRETRIGVHDVVGLLQNGETVESVTRCFPGLTRAQVYECLAYYEDHIAEIDHLIARQMEESGS